MEFETFGDLVRWLLTPAGLGVAVVAIVAWIRRWAEREGVETTPLRGWVAGHLWVVSVVVAAALGGGAFVVQRYGLARYVEEYWPLVVLVLGAVTWGTSQAVYTTVRAAQRNERSK